MSTPITAHVRNIRMSARKVRLVANLVRGLPLDSAFSQLAVVVKAARLPVEKLLKSALANAENNFQKDRTTLFVQEIQVNESASLKRWRPRAFGRAAPIAKHACTISVVLGEVPGSAVGKKKGGASLRMNKKTPSDVVVVPEEGHDHTNREGAAGHAPAIFDRSRVGKHETAQRANKKEKKAGFMKKIIQRKTG